MARTETMEIGFAPTNEDCAQVGSDGYETRSRVECYAYLNQLYRFLRSKGHNTETLPGNFRLAVKSSSHDYGTYREVVAKFDADNGAAWELALLLEGSGPEHWDDEAKQEIASKMVR